MKTLFERFPQMPYWWQNFPSNCSQSLNNKQEDCAVFKVWLKIMFVLSPLGFLFMLSCLKDPVPPLQIGTNVWPGYEPLYVARDLNYFTETEIRLIEFNTSSAVIRAFRNGAIDAAALTLDEVITLAQYDREFQVILIMDISNGADVIMGQPELKKFKDVAGKRIGFENTVLGAYVLTRALQLSNLTHKEIQPVPLELKLHESAFLNRQVDAVVTFEPIRTRLLEKGAKILFDSTQIPGEIVDVLIVKKNYLARYPDRIDLLLSAWFRSLNFFNQNPGEFAKLSASRLKLRPDEVLASYDGLILPDLALNRRYLSDGRVPLLNTAAQLKRIMLTNKLITRDVSIEGLINSTFIEEKKP